ncbi:interferon lambda-3-like [Lithobates pipiens]
MDIRLLALTIFIAVVSGRPHGKTCPLSRYLSVSSADMTVLRQLQHGHENAMSIKAMSCYRRMLRHKPSACDLTSSDALLLTLEQVSLVIDVLSDMSTFAVTDPVTQALMIFLKMKDDLMTCRESMEYSGPASPQLKAWLDHFQHFQEVVPLDCVRHAVLLNLITLRMENVTCWALNQ